MAGFIRTRTNKNGKKSYDVIVDLGFDADGKRLRKWKSFSKKREADDYLVAVSGQVKAGAYVEPTRQSVADFMTDWLDSLRPSLKPNTVSSYQNVLDLYIKPRIGHLRVKDLDASKLGRLYVDLLEHGGRATKANKTGSPLSPRTVRYVHAVLKMALAHGVKMRKLAHNPANDVAQPREQKVRDIRPWTAQQVGEFLKHAKSDPLFAAFRLAASTGMRRGEIAALKWTDIDFEAGRLTISRNRVVVDGKAVDGTPKTEGSSRTIGLDPETVEALRQHRVQQLADAKDDAAPPDVFMLDGKPIHPESLAYRFGLLVRSSGLPWLTMHGLRHSWATIALGAGVPVKVVSGRLGHSSTTITMEVYQRWLPEMDAGAANTVAALFSRPVEAV